jgi:hypothetical protein
MEGPRPEQLRTLFRWFKEGPPGAIPIVSDGRSLGLLQAAGWEDAGTVGVLDRLARWHPPSSARGWLVERLQDADGVLFWIKDVRGQTVGHAGLSHLDPEAGTVALSDVHCGDLEGAALVEAAVRTLLGWVEHSLRVRALVQKQQLPTAA